MNVAQEPRYGGALVDTAAVVVKIKEAILTGVRQGASERSIKAKVKKLIDEFCKQISDETYKMRARRVLAESFAKWYSTTQAAFLALPFLLLSRFDGVPKKTAVAAEKQFNRLPVDIRARIADLTPHAEYGREWHDSDYRKRLKEAYTRYVARLADDDAKYSKHVSLRNLAEVEVRRQEIADMLGRLRSQGVRLVWASSHVDCSKRCAPWQGRLYSLDGTSGVENSTSFVPIETAINVVDKYGNINGLFGYNCRHRLVPYTKNSQAPREYTHEQMSRERAIDQRQRELEKLVRRWKERGYVLRRENKEASGKAFERARYWEDVYKKYSLSHGRAFYRERITVMREEYENL